MCFDFLYNFFSETLPILRNTHQDATVNVHGYSREVPITSLSDFNKTRIFSTIFGNPQISNFTKIRPVGAELFHEDGRTERHGQACSRFSQICQRVKEQDAYE